MSSTAWPTVKLKELAEFKNGVNFNKNNFGKGMPVINVRDFQNYTYPDYGALEEINPEGVVKEKDLLNEDDIIFVRSNGNRGLIGRSLYLKDVRNRKITHSAFTIRVRFNSVDVCPRFYSYLFRSDLIRKELSAKGCGTNINNLNQQILSDLVVPLPSLKEQKCVAAILETYDNLIENNNRRIAILEDMAQSLYREWFVNFRFPGHENTKLIDSPLGKILEGWVVKPINSFIDIKSGFAFKSKSFVPDGEYQLITIKNVKDGQFVPVSDSRIDDLQPNLPEYCHLKTGDILLSLTGNIGRVCLVYGEGYLLNQRVAKLISRDQEAGAYIFHV